MLRSISVLLLGALVSAGALANSQGKDWKTIAELPDWSGVWDVDWRSFNGSSATGETAPKLTPEFAARHARFQAAQKRGEEQQTETANCVPPGMPGIMAQPYPVEFLFTPGKVTLAIEAYSQMRRIFTDGRPHPPDPDPTFQGHSIGRWEGDTLVVDTVAILPDTFIAPGIEHSDELRIEERIRKISDDTIQIRTTMHDKKALHEPLTLVRNYKRHLDWDIKEYVCQQNNRDSADTEGRAGLNLER